MEKLTGQYYYYLQDIYIPTPIKWDSCDLICMPLAFSDGGNIYLEQSAAPFFISKFGVSCCRNH